jgi:hypothetical protein
MSGIDEFAQMMKFYRDLVIVYREGDMLRAELPGYVPVLCSWSELERAYPKLAEDLYKRGIVCPA